MRERVIIIGAGLAGAATAWQLARRGGRDVAVLEKERLPGLHSSGRNAAMIRQLVDDPDVARLARDGARFLDERAGPGAGFRFERKGSILLAPRADVETMVGRLHGAGALDAEPRWLDPHELGLELEILRDAPHEGGVHCPTDGVVDAAGLLQFYLREARGSGASIETSTAVHEIVTEAGRVTGVVTSRGHRPADVVVNAAGPWAAEVARRAGASCIPHRPLRRHLHYTGRLGWVDPDWPFVWDTRNEWYLRPESGGLLLCAGDEDEVAPGEPAVEPNVIDLLHGKLTRHLPQLPDLPVAKTWAGLRTFAPDRSFVIGWDDALAGFFWVTGLGGHGVTCSYGVGVAAARGLEAGPEHADPTFTPARFAAKKI